MTLHVNNSVTSCSINAHLHTHAGEGRVEPGKTFFEVKLPSSFSALWSRGWSPELDVNLLTLHWFSPALHPAVQLLRRRAPPPSMFYALREREAEHFCVLRRGAFSPVMHISSACSSSWSGSIGLDGSLAGDVYVWRERTDGETYTYGVTHFAG